MNTDIQGPSDHDLGAERPGIDDETYEKGGVEIDPALLAPASNWNNPNRVRGKRVFGRNDPCPCGSGKKLKKCHKSI